MAWADDELFWLDAVDRAAPVAGYRSERDVGFAVRHRCAQVVFVAVLPQLDPELRHSLYARP